METPILVLFAILLTVFSDNSRKQDGKNNVHYTYRFMAVREVRPQEFSSQMDDHKMNKRETIS